MICWRRVFHRSSDTRQGFSSATDNHELGFVDEFYTDGRYVCTFERREYSFIRLLANTHGNTRNTEREQSHSDEIYDGLISPCYAPSQPRIYHFSIVLLLRCCIVGRIIVASVMFYIYIYLSLCLNVSPRCTRS